MTNTARILIALLLGLAGGVAAGMADPATAGTLVAVARPVGTLWLDGLQMTIVPLVFALLVTGVASAADAARGGALAARAIGLFAIALLGAALIGGLLTPLILAFLPPPVEAGAALLGGADAGAVPPTPPLGDWLTSFVPTNPLRAAADSAMVPTALFALLFGLAAARLADDPRGRLVGLFDAVTQAMLVIVGWVLLVAPIGVSALAFAVGASAGLGAAGALVHYVLTICAVLSAVIVATYVTVVLTGRIGLGRFARGIAAAQTVGFSTQSSVASLPAMLGAARAGLGVADTVRDTVLPLAVSLFRITNPPANIAIALYSAHLAGVEVGIAQILIGSAVGAVMSLAAVGLPGQVSFFTTAAPTCLAIGAPVALLPLFLAVETIPDLFRTVGNVTADLAATRILGRRGARDVSADTEPLSRPA